MSQTRLNPRQLETLGVGNIATDDEVSSAINSHILNSNPHAQYLTIEANAADEKINNRGIPLGYAPLDANGMLPGSAIPSQTIVQIVQATNVDGGFF
jgi:hypothetical protein